MDDSILVFRTTITGNVAPARILKGSKTGLKNPTGVFVDNQNREVWVSNMGNHSATAYPIIANRQYSPTADDSQRSRRQGITEHR